MAIGSPKLDKKKSITCHVRNIIGDHSADPSSPPPYIVIYLLGDILIRYPEILAQNLPHPTFMRIRYTHHLYL